MLAIDCQFSTDTHIEKSINTTNQIHALFHFTKYSFIRDIFAKNTIATNSSHNKSLHTEINICDSHHIIQYHRIVTII